MNRRGLPIGIQDFRSVREQDFYYVDKTHLVRRLVDEGRFYFLSRPRRFGKSLLVDTLRSLFEGQETLFHGLDIHGCWDWSIKYPVVRLSLGGKYNEHGDVERNILNQLVWIEEEAQLDLPEGASLDGTGAVAGYPASPSSRYRTASGRPGGRVRQTDPRRPP